MLETQHIPLEQLKAQRNKAWEECCRLDWLICEEQNRLSDEMRKSAEAELDLLRIKHGGNLPSWIGPGGGLPKTYIG
ncbi:hypothetical protein [Delftia acidovorans]|uniref:hypothetical protein n=1 Tax=Delftia acidovorans TaxID=80866 RepID=UPI003D12CA5F